ncbi:hypothetical protein [Brotaphodocola sp.]|uniref:N-acetylmuramoyl-L-alanine amidase family protein n=1 Tax=Brotaphodocola sp. TaxID=3073577 RepID=UPI003D7EF59D
MIENEGIMGRTKGFLRLLLVMIFALNIACSAFASESEKITEVNLEIEAYLEDSESRGDVSVSTGDTTYRIRNIEVLNENEDWSKVAPKISVDFKAKKGYYFGTADEEMFSFEGDEVTFVSAKVKNSGSGMTLIFTLGSDEDDLSVHGLSWNEEDGFAEWEENDNARVYQVKLYRNDVAVGSTRTTKNTTYDFSEATSKSGRYRFMVRAVGTGSERGAWETSEIWHVLADEDEDLTGGMTASKLPATTSLLPVVNGKSAECWEKDETGWWYRYADGNYPSARWAKINGKWYFFDENGYMKTGWVKYKSKWYYCDESGAMLSGTTTPDGYSLGADGVWIP